LAWVIWQPKISLILSMEIVKKSIMAFRILDIPEPPILNFLQIFKPQ